MCMSIRGTFVISYLPFLLPTRGFVTRKSWKIKSARAPTEATAEICSLNFRRSQLHFCLETPAAWRLHQQAELPCVCPTHEQGPLLLLRSSSTAAAPQGPQSCLSLLRRRCRNCQAADATLIPSDFHLVQMLLSGILSCAEADAVQAFFPCISQPRCYYGL